MKISRRGQVPPFIVMDVMTAAAAREKTHGDVLHLEVGQPSTPAPAGVLAAVEPRPAARPALLRRAHAASLATVFVTRFGLWTATLVGPSLIGMPLSP